jgi:hypothetical protein
MCHCSAVLRIWIRKFFCLPELHSDPLVTNTDLAPDTIQQNSKKNLDFYCFVNSL